MTKIGEYDHAVSAELIVRDMTKEEIAEQKAIEAQFKKDVAAETAKQNAKAALLERLGITEEEASLLLS